MRLPRPAVILLAALLLAHCAAPIRVEEVAPPLPASLSKQELRSASKLARRQPAVAAGRLLDLIARADERIARGETELIPAYNYLVARFVANLERAELDPFTAPVSIAGGERTYTVDARQPRDLQGIDHLLVATDSLDFEGKYATDPVIKPGIGAPLVAKVGTEHGSGDQIRYRNVTALVRLQGSRATLELADPFATESVSYAGRSRPLAADYSSAVSYGLSHERIDKLGFARMLNPSRYADTTTLARLQPYDPDRIPVLMVHGLQDTPATWMPMYLSLMQDPDIREHYQFWAFSYPSGYPYPYSASLLRKALDQMNRDYPDHKDIVIVGHSMGGILSRLMISDAGDRIWLDYFGKPPAETRISGASREPLEQALVFRPRPDIDRAVFCSAPHRGADLATNWIGRLGSRLIRVPSFIADVRESVINVVTADGAALKLDRAPNSIDTLAPNDRFVRASKDLPIPGSIPYHSVIGDRGKGDTPDSSDGVVAYWSSHMDGAVSEKIVPSHHGSHQHPEGIAEVRRILKLHLRGR